MEIPVRTPGDGGREPGDITEGALLAVAAKAGPDLAVEEATGVTDTVALLRLSKAGVDVIETAITPRSLAAGRTLTETTLPAGAVIATVVRDGQPNVPTPETRLQPGDEHFVVSHAATEQDPDSRHRTGSGCSGEIRAIRRPRRG
jgi:trk system potassium uptake protein TrkA